MERPSRFRALVGALILIASPLIGQAVYVYGKPLLLSGGWELNSKGNIFGLGASAFIVFFTVAAIGMRLAMGYVNQVERYESEEHFNPSDEPPSDMRF